MLPIFFAYGEGKFANTATGIAFSLLTLLVLLISLGVYANQTYPSDRK